MIARLTVQRDDLTEYPLAERVPGGWQNGVTFYPDAEVSAYRQLWVSTCTCPPQSILSDGPSEDCEVHGVGQEWEFGINTGSEYNDSWTYPTAEDLLREMSVNGALGDRGSRIGKRRKAGEWQPLDRSELEAAIAAVHREVDGGGSDV